MVDEYEKDNLDTIEKLKRAKKVELNKIMSVWVWKTNIKCYVFGKMISTITSV
jgi:hypothetical protein